MTKRNAELWTLAALVLLALATLIPLLALGQYNYPSTDDFSYGHFTHQAFLHGESILAKIFSLIPIYYETWQGSFFSLGLMCLTPCIFSIRLYALVPFIMLGILLAGIWKLSDTLFRRWLGGSWRLGAIVGLTLYLLSVNLVPEPVSTFYWYNGSVYYTFSYGLMLLFVDRLAALCLAKTGTQYALACVPAALLGIMVGGSNYVSALLCLLLTLLFCLGLFLWGMVKKQWRPLLFSLLPLAALTAAFAVNVLCPGNAVRQATVASSPPLLAILASIDCAWTDLLLAPKLLPLLALLALAPALYPLLRRLSFPFPWPIAFTVFSFLLFAAQNTPHIYATSTLGPDRLRSIVFYAFFWLLLANLMYWLGWLGHRKKAPGTLLPPGLPKPVLTVLTVAVLSGALLLKAPGLNATRAAASLADGSAQAYGAVWEERLAILSGPDPDPELPPLPQHPLLFNFDIDADPTVWTNQAMANFFGKTTVRLNVSQ